uniref:Uncharacterized protein n=1 Tax=Anser cygnoides TaxID=8845 RepID=A0A8B9DWZ3_ANSCY
HAGSAYVQLTRLSTSPFERDIRGHGGKGSLGSPGHRAQDCTIVPRNIMTTRKKVLFGANSSPSCQVYPCLTNSALITGARRA